MLLIVLELLMLSPQEFAAAWGEDRYCFPPDILHDVDIPASSIQFLVEAGLPRQAEGPRPYIVPLPRVLVTPPVQAARHPLLTRYGSTPFRLLAYLHTDNYLDDKYALYHAVEEKTGHIYWVGPGVRTEPPSFVNTSITHFAEFLLCFRDFGTRFRQAEPIGSRIRHVPFSTLKREWQVIDPAALTDPDNYWVMAYYDIMECF